MGHEFPSFLFRTGVPGGRLLMVLLIPEDRRLSRSLWFNCHFLFFVVLCFFFFFSVALHTPSGAVSMVVRSRGSSLSLTDPLAEVRREAPDLAEIAEEGEKRSFVSD